jgi:hypothetical protein
MAFPGKKDGLSGSSAVFGVPAFQELLFPLLLVFIFPFGWGGIRAGGACIRTWNEEGRSLEGEQSDGGQEHDAAKFSHDKSPSRFVTCRS